MELECQKCGREWDYQGDSDYYATCPNCKSSVKISEQKVKQ
jgi:DNA-directed RNA polymerase subunit RPC12/RpoP